MTPQTAQNSPSLSAKTAKPSVSPPKKKSGLSSTFFIRTTQLLFLVLKKVQIVPHPGFLGMHIILIIGIGLHLYGNVLNNLQSITFESNSLNGIIGHQTHFTHPQLSQNLSTHTIVALIGLKTQFNIGIHGIQAFFLKFVSGNLAH